ncbi:MAG TPA: putative cytokinetic ring protein SteA [Nocardioidaceae bacterium]|nr:putative cytokinetic ring protein SteA [Nocardioidaceae bacterium]
MRFPLRQKDAERLPGIVATARVDRRTTALAPRLRPGDIAVIDHLDLDRDSAEVLVDRGAVAVVNASPFISGRYANLGPELLARSGVALVDNVGSDIFTKVNDGATIRLHDGELFVKGDPVAAGRALTADDVQALMEEARSGLFNQLQSFTHNTTEFLRREQELLLHGQGAPKTKTLLHGRPAVIVVARYDYREDLKRLKRYIHEQRPVLIGVDGGADALLAAGHRADLVVVGESGLARGGSRPGDGGTISDKALRGGREVVLHTDRAGRVVGSDRLARLGVHPLTFAAESTSEDVAMMLADLSGASMIISVGTHATLDEFLDRHRSGLASTFLTRLRVGTKLVDAKSVPQLYAGRVRVWHLFLILLAGVIALVLAVGATPVGQEWWASMRDSLEALASWIQGLFS